MTRRALAPLVFLLGAALPAAGDEAARPRYGPVPAAIEALSASSAEERLAAEAVVALDDRDPAVAAAAARRLLLARNAGLRRAVERLAAGDVPDRVLLLLLQVVGASPHASADAVLVAAASEPLPEARALVTLGLGAGRTGAAVEALARLARDPSPAVRAAALRALYAIESPVALAARRALPRDANPELQALRLRLQRLRGETGPAALSSAVRAWLGGRTATERLAGMRLLAAQGPDAPVAALAWVVGELAGPTTAVAAARVVLGWPRHGYPVAEARTAAAEALVAWLRRPRLDPAERDAILEVGVSWIARPADDGGRPTDEEARALLFGALPDAGAPLAGPVARRLRRGEFEDPVHAVRLLVGLPRDAALEALQGLVLGPGGLEPRALAAVAGGFRDLGRIGDDETARRLLGPTSPPEARTTAVLALEEEDAARALPLLADLVRAAGDDVASLAAGVLEHRSEPRAREILEGILLDGTWMPFEHGLLERLLEPADDAAWAFLDRAFLTGSRDLREAVFETIAHPRCALRGPRALALVRRAIADPALGLDTGTIGKAIAPVDGAAAVEFIGARWRAWRNPPILVRNLQVSTGPEPREFALRLAAELGDGDETLLKELATVLAGACEKAPDRTDPFWRRLLASRSEELRRFAVHKLGRTAHGPMSALLVPLLADRTLDASLRLEALAAVRGEPGQPPDDLLWALASDRVEDDDVRAACARILLARDVPAIREKALAWIAERLDEHSDAVLRIAEIAGRGATAAQAADLLQLLQDELAERYAGRPYFRVRTDGIDAQRASRVAALVRGLAATGDEASLDALADLLFDPRFATYSAEARLHEALRHPRGGGPLAALRDPPEIEVLLHQVEEDPNVTPASPIPAEAAEIVDALARRGPEEGGRRLRAAVERASASARLALFTDVYLFWLANRLRQGGEERVTQGAGPEAEAVAMVLEDALALTWPAAGPEEIVATERRARRLDREGSWAEAATVLAGAARLAARTGLADIPPARWLDRGLPPGTPWIVLRAQEDLLLGAAAAAAGKPEEARDAFRRGVARAPADPRVLRSSARWKAASGFDLAAAETEALRALELERRQGDWPSDPSLRALQRVRARRTHVPPR